MHVLVTIDVCNTNSSLFLIYNLRHIDSCTTREFYYCDVLFQGGLIPTAYPGQQVPGYTNSIQITLNYFRDMYIQPVIGEGGIKKQAEGNIVVGSVLKNHVSNYWL